MKTRDERNEYSREWMKKRRATDPEFRRRQNESSHRYNSLHPRCSLSPEERLRKAEYYKEWRKKHPEKVKAYEKTRRREPRLQVSQVRYKIKYFTKLLAKIEAQVKTESERRVIPLNE